MDNDDGFREHGIYGPGVTLFAVTVAMQAVAWFSMIIRLISRKMTPSGLGKDDYILFVAGFFDTVMTGITIAAVEVGYGNPNSDLSHTDQLLALQMFWITQFFYKMVTGLVKISFLVFYSRIFPRNNKRFFYANRGMLVLVIAYTIAAVLGTVFQCIPLHRSWDKSYNWGRCINLNAFWYCNGIASIISDFAIMVLPWPLVYGLHTSRKDKIGLMLLFSVGIFIIGTSVARFTTLKLSANSLDQTAGTLESTTWTSVESNTMIICACLPAFKPPVKFLLNKVFRKSHPASTLTSNDSGPPGNHGRRSSILLGDINIRTDVDIVFEPKSGGSSSEGCSPRCVVSAHEVA